MFLKKTNDVRQDLFIREHWCEDAPRLDSLRNSSVSGSRASGTTGESASEDIAVHTGQATPMERGHRWACTIVKTSRQEASVARSLVCLDQIMAIWSASHDWSLGPRFLLLSFPSYKVPLDANMQVTSFFLPGLQISLPILIPHHPCVPLFPVPTSQTGMKLGTRLPPLFTKMKQNPVDQWSLKAKGALYGMEEH